MDVTLPQLEVNFKQLATSFIERSERGVAVLIIRDDTVKTFNYKEYVEQGELDKDELLYSDDNFTNLTDILSFGVAKLVVVRIDEVGVMADALSIISNKLKTGWISTVGENADYESLATWVKARALEGKTYKVLCYKLTAPNSEYVHNFTNPYVTFKDGRGRVTGDNYIPSLLAILCVCNVTRGVTYYVCKNLSEVDGVADVKIALNNGELVLINDFDKVRVGTGINSLVTIDPLKGQFDDMKYIEIMEATDMIKDDIRDIYKNDYVGSHKNNLDNQMIFISAVNTYFGDLAESEILDNNYDNLGFISIAKQRKAWESTNPEAKLWDDTKVKNMSYKRSTFLGADIKVLGSMMNLDFDVLMV